MDILNQSQDVHQMIVMKYAEKLDYQIIRALRESCKRLCRRVNIIMNAYVETRLWRFVQCTNVTMVSKWLCSDKSCGGWPRAIEYLDLLRILCICGTVSGETAWLIEILTNAKTECDMPLYGDVFPDRIDAWIDSKVKTVELEERMEAMHERQTVDSRLRRTIVRNVEQVIIPKRYTFLFRWHRVYVNTQPTIREKTEITRKNWDHDLKEEYLKKREEFDSEVCECASKGVFAICRRCVTKPPYYYSVWDTTAYGKTRWIPRYPHASSPLSNECVALKLIPGTEHVQIERLTGDPRKIKIRLQGLIEWTHKRVVDLAPPDRVNTALYRVRRYMKIMKIQSHHVEWSTVKSIINDTEIMVLDDAKKEQLSKGIEKMKKEWNHKHEHDAALKYLE